MNKILYLECYSGISGDMAVAALLDLGADERALCETLKTLPLDGYKIEITKVKKSGLAACDFHVILEEENHDHDMEYLYGHEHVHAGHEHDHEGHGHDHEGHRHTHEGHRHTHEGHGHGHHGHLHRGMKEIREIIERSGMTPRAKKIALDIFEVLAQAEAKAHGTGVEDVHFHEVGAADSIADIAAAAICLDNLNAEEIIVSELYEGRGTVRCQHGVIPVPVPAVVNIAAEHGLTLHMTNVEGEMVTPTGAAIAAAVRTGEKLPSKYKIQRVGMGAGKRDYGRAGVVRAMWIEPQSE